MTDELKPCPFCGGKVKIERTIDGRKWWGVVCRNSQNVGGTCGISIRARASEEAAVKSWNTRAPQPANAELVKRLQQLADTSTPAPWGHIRGSEDGDEFRCAIVAERKKNAYLVATIENGAPGDVCDTELANAKLIAELRNNLPTIIAALAKLEGKTP